MICSLYLTFINPRFVKNGSESWMTDFSLLNIIPHELPEISFTICPNWIIGEILGTNEIRFVIKARTTWFTQHICIHNI